MISKKDHATNRDDIFALVPFSRDKTEEVRPRRDKIDINSDDKLHNLAIYLDWNSGIYTRIIMVTDIGQDG